MINPSEVLLRENDNHLMLCDVVLHAKKHEETVMSLIGIIHPNRIYEVTRVVIDAPQCQRGAVSCSTDNNEVTKALQEEKGKNPESRYLGDFHLHPWPVTPQPSSTDYQQLYDAKKDRNWFVIGVFSSAGELKIFGMVKNSLVDIPFRIIPDGFNKEDHLSRISKITNNEKLGKSKVLIAGCGSLGSAVINGTAGTGIQDYIVADMDDTLSVSNTTRHVGGLSQVGTKKTEIFKRFIQSHQPLARVQTVDEDLVKNTDLLRQLIEWSDVVVSASGNPELHFVINSICVDMKKPAIFGGIYKKAREAYVFYYSAKDDDGSCCWECIMDIATAKIDQGMINRRYGLEDSGELHAEQGLNCDIAIPGLVMAKIALSHLMRNEIKYNLMQYYDTPRMRLILAKRKPNCAVCNAENWLEEQKKLLEEKRRKSDGKLSDVFEKLIKHILKTRIKFWIKSVEAAKKK